MDSIKFQVEDYCRELNIKYQIFISEYTNEQIVLINDEYWFDLKTNFDLYICKTYIDIIIGKNEIVNMICENLNISVKNGCRFETYERCNEEDMCIKNNTFIISIDNIDITSTKLYTKYKKYINFELKICVLGELHYELKYYLIDKDKIEIEFSKISFLEKLIKVLL